MLHTEIHIYCVTLLKSMFIASPINNLMDIVSSELKKSAKRPKIGFHEDCSNTRAVFVLVKPLPILVRILNV